MKQSRTQTAPSAGSRLPTGVRQFLTSFAAGLTAIGLVNLVRWLRAPVTGR
ncbi:MAG TPA: hypothetical protein VFX49_22335 [Chloroflexota bacterium]|nr:hypothetical protein [Chloroflexota bacterium]